MVWTLRPPFVIWILFTEEKKIRRIWFFLTLYRWICLGHVNIESAKLYQVMMSPHYFILSWHSSRKSQKIVHRCQNSRAWSVTPSARWGVSCNIVVLKYIYRTVRYSVYVFCLRYDISYLTKIRVCHFYCSMYLCMYVSSVYLFFILVLASLQWLTFPDSIVMSVYHLAASVA